MLARHEALLSRFTGNLVLTADNMPDVDSPSLPWPKTTAQGLRLALERIRAVGILKNFHTSTPTRASSCYKSWAGPRGRRWGLPRAFLPTDDGPKGGLATGRVHKLRTWFACVRVSAGSFASAFGGGAGARS